MLGQARECSEQSVDELRPKPAGGPLFQRTQIDIETNDWEVGVKTWPDVDGPVNDFH